MSTSRQKQLLAKLIAEALRPYSEAVGVIVRDVLTPDAEVLLQRLLAMHREEGFPNLRIAYLPPGGADAAKHVAISDDVFSTEVEQAERWRNERDLKALIVVVARGDEAKLSSLEDFATVTSRDLKSALVDLAMEGPVGENVVQTLLWQTLADDTAVGLGQLVDYYLSLEGKDSTDFKAASSRELHRVGLLPDPGLLEHRKPAAMRRRLASNREIVGRLQMLTPKDRRTIKGVVDAETDPTEKAKLSEALGRLHRTRSAGGTRAFIDFDHAQRLVKLRAKRSRPSKGKQPRPATEKSSNIAAGALVDHTRRADLSQVLTSLREKLASMETVSARTERVRTHLPDSMTEAFSIVRLDVLNVVGKVLDDGTYGGLIQIDIDDIDEVLRRFNAEEHVVGTWKREEIVDVLENIAEVTPSGRSMCEHFHSYDRARTAILPYMRALAVEPLVVAADSEARRKLLLAVRAYSDLTRHLRENYDNVFDVVGSDIDELVGRLLLTDIVVVKGEERIFAILSPVHPLFVWHYATYADVVDAQRSRFEDRDKRLVAEAARRLPNFLTSIYIPAGALGQGKSLTSAGRISQLPYYAEAVVGGANDDGVEAISDLFASYVALEPHARNGLRVALVDPPDAGPYLCGMVDLRDGEIIDGAHVVVYRHRSASLSAELRLAADDEDHVAQVFRTSSVHRRFTFEVRDRPAGDVGPRHDEPFHIAVVFDRSNARMARTRAAVHPIQPLAVPRRLHYSTVHRTVELEPETGGLFHAYQSLVNRVAEGGGQAAYLTVHQQRNLRQELTELSERVGWTVVADRHIDRDLSIGKLRIFTASEGEREVAAFARSTAAFRRPLREVARQYNTFITNPELDELLQQLSDLLDSGLLNVKPDRTGRVNESRMKGLLATLIAARWYRKDAAAETRLLVSLDGRDARRWMHLSDDPLRADLVGFEWTGDHCTVTVIEVKSVEATGREYRIAKGVASGPAVDQMLATRRLLAAILSQQREDELITTPARREILREHLYRELTKATYSPSERKLWADRLQRMLDGAIKVQVGCHLIDVRLGVDSAMLRDRMAVAEDDGERVPTRIRELNEELIDGTSASRSRPDRNGEAGQLSTTGGTGSSDSGPGNSRKSGTSKRESPTASGHHMASDVVKDVSAKPPSEPRGAGEEPIGTRTRVLLGMAPGSYGKPRDVWFDPNLPGQELPNPHVSITGETGSGKTQATKAIVSELRARGLPALVLDFKDDYSNPSFIEAEGFCLYDASYSALPLNPLVPAIDMRQSRINAGQHTYQITDIVKRIYKLGDQQAFRLREAIKRAYEGAGIPLGPGKLPPGKSFPAFDTVKHQLLDDRANEPLLGRLSPIFDLGLFSASSEQSSFDSFFEASAVIRLGQLPGDEVKNSVAEFFLMALYNHLIRQPQVHMLGRLLVLDEAWRVAESPFLTPLMREGRAFGLGVVIASQFPRDLPEAVRGSTATRLFFSQGQVEQIREIQRTIVGKTSGPEAEHVGGVVRGLTPLSCLIHSTQYTPFVRVGITPYFRRRRAGALR